MRFFSSILIIIIMAMHLVPCSDAYASAAGRIKSEIVKKDTKQKQNKSDECTPFCSCTCCAIHGVTKSKFTIAHHPHFFSSIYPEYSQGDFIDVSLPIWQPPQLIS